MIVIAVNMRGESKRAAIDSEVPLNIPEFTLINPEGTVSSVPPGEEDDRVTVSA